MSRVYESIRHEVENQLRETELESSNEFKRGEDKPLSIRLPEHLVHPIDAMAALMSQSRNAFLIDILCDAMNDAIDGYCAAFGDDRKGSARDSFFELVSKLESGVLKPREIRSQEGDQ